MPRRSQGPKLVFLRKRKVYYIRWNERGERGEHSTGTTDLQEAQAKLGAFIAERQRTNAGSPPNPTQVRIADVLADYAEARAPQIVSGARIGFAIGALLDFLGNKPVSDITPTVCDAYARNRGRADGTIRRELGVLRAALKWAEQNNRLSRAPFVRLPAPPPGKDRWLTRSEVARLVQAARNGRDATGLYLPHFILLSLYTGGRKSAVLEMRWTQVNFDRQQIDLNPSGRRQTTKRRPTVPMPPKLLGLLRRLRKRGSDIGYVIHRDGARINDIKKSFGYAARKANLPGVTPHTLRHTCGTWLAQAGVPLFEISGWLGHSHARTTELYAHHHPSYLKQALASFQKR